MKKISCTIALLTTILFTSAADDDFFSFDDLDEGDQTVAVSGIPSSPVEFSGSMATGLTGYFDDNEESSQIFTLDSTGEIKISTAEAEAVLKLSVNRENFTDDLLTVSDFMDEAYIHYYFDKGNVEAGYFITEWGKGDGLHAVDPINALDQSQGFGVDMEDAKIAVPMVKLNINAGMNKLIEAVYIPVFIPTRLAMTGNWALFDPEVYSITDNPPETSWENVQGGLRYTFTAGPTDLGFMYYHGYLHDQGFSFTGATDISLQYTMMDIFALEGAAAWGAFTFRAEAGYYLSEDRDGKDPTLYNSKLAYLAGFDVTIPGTELFLSAQWVGDYTFDTDGLAETDVDVLTGYGTAERLNTFVAAVEHPFFHQKMNTRISTIFSLEAEGYYLSPEITYDLSDELELKAVYSLYEDFEEKSFSTYTIWDDNDNLKLSLTYSF